MLSSGSRAPAGCLQVPDLGLQEQPGATDQGIRDAGSSQPVHDDLPVPVPPVQDRDVAPAPRFGQHQERLPDPLDDELRLVGLVRGEDELDGIARLAGRAQRLTQLQSPDVVADEPVRGIQDPARGAAVLQQRQARDGAAAVVRAPRRAGRRIAPGSAEGRVAGTPEPVDRLVVVTHDDHVVRLVRSATDELQQRDLGHVRVLEFVHEHVPELALVAQQQVRPVEQQLDGERHLLAEVEHAASAELCLVPRVDLGLLLRAAARSSASASRRKVRFRPLARTR